MSARYGAVHVGHNRYVRAHRYAYELLVGPIRPGLHILHSCDNKLCCNPEHLREGTNAENMRDRANRGFVKSRKLTRESLVRLREMLSAGFTQRAIAKELGITTGVIHKILSGRTYTGAQYE